MMRPAPAIAAPLMHERPTPPQPMYRNRRARLDFGGVDHGADAGGDAAADQRGAIERHVGADLHDRVFVHQHAFGERRQIQELIARAFRRR